VGAPLTWTQLARLEAATTELRVMATAADLAKLERAVQERRRRLRALCYVMAGVLGAALLLVAMAPPALDHTWVYCAAIVAATGMVGALAWTLLGWPCPICSKRLQTRSGASFGEALVGCSSCDCWVRERGLDN